MPAAGESVIAGRVPGERIATTTRTASSGNIVGTETVIDSVTADLVTGRTYRIKWTGHVSSTVADGYTRLRIREDSLVGTQLKDENLNTAQVVNQSFPIPCEVEFVAVATASKTFVATLQRQAGTGNNVASAAATTPTYFYVEYVRG